MSLISDIPIPDCKMAPPVKSSPYWVEGVDNTCNYAL